MPLGNGRLGAAVWSADGLTAQLNRADTEPGRVSPGRVVVPGLRTLVSAKDYKGRVDLYDGMLRESGNGMTATIYVRADKAELVIDVTGADPHKSQTVQVRLWKPRQPVAHAHGELAVLSDTWKDDRQPGASGRTFGTLAALTVGGRKVHAEVVNRHTIQATFTPYSDGRYRILVAAPHWVGGNVMAVARKVLADDAHEPARQLRHGHLEWWHRFWHRVGLMKLTSADGVAQYMENLRAIYLYTAAAEDRSHFPASHYGNGGLFAWSKGSHQASFWHFNLRMQVAANLGAGAFKLNAPYFRLYRDNLVNLKKWTKQRMDGRSGICIPETMRFNGNGIEYEPSSSGARTYFDCDASSPPMWNARTISTGAEVSLWIWRQYLYTNDRSFLTRNYPIMSNAARFLLAYAKVGSQGKLHTNPSNAHETQWDVKDPTTDISAMKALFPLVIKAATRLHRDPGLVQRLKKAIPHVLPFPRTDAVTHTKLLPKSADASRSDVIAPSYNPAARRRNRENIGMEPVWPYKVINLSQPESLGLARRTFKYRVTRHREDWSYDAVDAARLGLAGSMRRNLIAITRTHQAFPSGLADLYGSITDEPFVEQSANVALALQQALVQEDQGVLQIARAWPRGWSGAGTVYIHDGSKVSVQMHGGKPVTVGIQAGYDTKQRIRNPWPGQRIQVIESSTVQRGSLAHSAQRKPNDRQRVRQGQSGVRVPVAVKVLRHGHPVKVAIDVTSAKVFTLSLHRGKSYLVERVDKPTTALPYAPETGMPATSYKTLGPVSIGLPPRVDARTSRRASRRE